MLKRVLSIVVTVALLLTMACFAFADTANALTVAVDQTNVRPGDKVTATVQLNNYTGDWSAISVDVVYDPGLFALDGALEEAVKYDAAFSHVINHEGEEVSVVSEVNVVGDGRLRFVWMCWENIPALASATLATVNLVALEDADKMAETAMISAAYVADGMISTDPSGLPSSVPAGDLPAGARSEEMTVGGIAWDDQPKIRVEFDEPARVQDGSSVTATVYVDRYIPWNRLSVELGLGEYEFSKYLAIETVEPLGFAGEVAVVEGNIINITADSNVAGAGEYLVDGTLKAFKVTLGVHDVDAIIESRLAVGFTDGGQQMGGVALTEGVQYDGTVAQAAMTLVPKKTELKVDVALPEGGLNAGETFDVTVSLKDHANAWAAFTLVGVYDRDLFEIAVDEETGEKQIIKNENGYSDVIVDFETVDATEKLKVVWINAENVAFADPNAELMTITFRAKKATTDANIGFYFAENGVIAEGEDGVLAPQKPNENYTGEEKDATVTVAPTPMKVVTTVEGDVSELKAGKTFSVKVSVKDYYEDLAALSLKSVYDPANFELVGVQSLLTFGEGGEFITPDIDAINGGEEDLDLVWINAENVDLPAEFDAAVLTLRAKKAAENATVDVEFLPSGILRVDKNGMPETLVDEQGSSAYFTAENDPAVVTVAPAKVLLEVVTDAKNVMAGDEFTVEVYVIDYYSPLAAISINGKLDEKFEVLSCSAEILGGVEPVQDGDGQLQFVWASAENIEIEEQRFKVLTLKVKALQSTTAEDVIAFNFINGGMVRVDGDGGVSGLEAGTDYADPANPAENQKATINVSVAKRPVQLSAAPKTAGTVEAGKTFDVVVSISDFYEGDWSSLGIWANFDSADFAVENATTDPNFDGVFSWTLDNKNAEEPKPFVAGWVALNNVAKFPEMTVTFLAKEDAAIDEAMEQIDFYFASNAINTCVDYDTMQYKVVENTDDCAYESEAVPVRINITAPEAMVQYELSWGNLKFSYEFGTWDIENHEWNGAGWICEEGADEITVENTGSVGFNAGFEFTKNGESLYDLTNLTGSFIHEDAPLVGQITIEVGQPIKTVLFALNGRTEQVWDDQQTIGSITVTITADGAIDEEVTQ